MHLRASVVLGLGLVLTATSASADTYYRYRDQRTGRDVFVNRLDQVPQKYRHQAKIVLETDVPAAEPAKDSPVEIVPPPTTAGRPTLRNTPLSPPSSDEMRSALSAKTLLRDGPGVASAVIDTQLVNKGAPPLTTAESKSFAHLIILFLIAASVAGLAALIAWIVILVTAVRDGHPWWFVFIFLFSPLGYVYVFVHGGKDRGLWKALCTLGMLAPALVGVVGAWRFYAWFQAVIQARGGKL
jgi:hypothetical protein